MSEQSIDETKTLQFKLDKMQEQNIVLQNNLNDIQNQLNLIFEVEAQKKIFREKRKARVIQKKEIP